MAGRIENPELDRLVREMAARRQRGELIRGQLKLLILDAANHCHVSVETVYDRYDKERALLTARTEASTAPEPAAAPSPALSLYESRRRAAEAEAATVLASDVQMLVAYGERERAREKLKELRTLAPDLAGRLETELRLKI